MNYFQFSIPQKKIFAFQTDHFFFNFKNNRTKQYNLKL